MVRKEVERPFVVARGGEEFMRAFHEVRVSRRRVRHGHVVGVDVCVESAASVAADLEMRELLLQVWRDSAVKPQVFRKRRAPHRIAVHVRVVLRLVPDFPVVDLHLEAVCPAFGIVADHVLADAAPLREVLGRHDVHRGIAARDEVLDSDTQAEERLDIVLLESLQKRIGVDEAVALRVFLVGVEVREYDGNVDEEPAAEPAAHVMKARIRDAGLLEIVEHRIVCKLSYERRLPHAVYALYRPSGGIEVDLYLGRMGAGRASRNQCKRNSILHVSSFPPILPACPQVYQISPPSSNHLAKALEFGSPFAFCLPSLPLPFERALA